MNHPSQIRCLTAAAALIVGTSAFALDIDTFSDLSPQVVASPSGLLPSNDTSVAASALGGFRQLTAAGGTGTLGTIGKVEDGALAYANSPSSAGSLSVIYDANGAGLDGVDLTDGGTATGILFSILYADLPTQYTITVTGSGVGPLTGTFPSGILEPADAQDVYIDFAAFGGGNFTNVSAIQFDFEPATTGIAGNDLILDSITTGVPEPSSIALLALGGLAMMRRRR